MGFAMQTCRVGALYFRAVMRSLLWLCNSGVWLVWFVLPFVCVRERERERDEDGDGDGNRDRVCVCMCVCVY